MKGSLSGFVCDSKAITDKNTTPIASHWKEVYLAPRMKRPKKAVIGIRSWSKTWRRDNGSWGDIFSTTTNTKT